MSICMVAAFPPWLHSFTQPHLVTTQCSHSFAFLATEQLNWSNWGFSAFSKGTSTVAAERWEDISHSFKAASPMPSSLTFRQAQFLICVSAGSSSVKLCYEHKHKPRVHWRLGVWQREIHYIAVIVMFVESASVTAARFEKWAPHSEPSDVIPVRAKLTTFLKPQPQIGYEALGLLKATLH